VTQFFSRPYIVVIFKP
jgi:hypothetical protein